MNKSELAREMMKVVFGRIGRTDLDAARKMILGFSPEEAEQVRLEARANLEGVRE